MQKQTPLQSMLSGACGGFSLVGVAHPFDLLKVRMQNSNISSKTSFTTATMDIIRKDGFLGLYRGVKPVLIGTPLILAINLFAYNRAQSFIYGDKFESIDQLTLFEIAQAGFLSSIPTSLVLSPAELVKIRLQVGEKGLTATKVFKLALQNRVLGRGLGLTLMRDCIGSLFYFSTYESIKRLTRKEDNSLSPISILLGGGIAGIVNWTIAMPFDNMKTRFQVKDTITIGEVIKSLNQKGIQSYFVGLRPTLIRAFPASMAFFGGVETSLYIMRKF
jgi:solute carrier family 25 (mitochondrial carnitine/acylcarnitine transporter), member 20/29